MSVINSTTKGKNERIELAATEKAKVCTSVRSRYFAVDTTIPAEPRRRRRLGTSSVWAVVAILGLVTILSNPIKGSGSAPLSRPQAALLRPDPPHFLYAVKACNMTPGYSLRRLTNFSCETI